MKATGDPSVKDRRGGLPVLPCMTDCPVELKAMAEGGPTQLRAAL
jgi:hypothetical protein